MMLLGSMCWCRENIYIPTKCTLFRIMHQTKAQDIIQFHNNKIENRYVFKNLSYSTKTYLWSKIQSKKQVEKYIWFLYHKLVLLLKSRNCFCYVPDNDTKGEILVWNPSQYHNVLFGLEKNWRSHCGSLLMLRYFTTFPSCHFNWPGTDQWYLCMIQWIL